MVDWWEEHGLPVYLSVAAYLGTNKPKDKKSSSSPSKGDLNELLKLAGPGGMIN